PGIDEAVSNERRAGRHDACQRPQELEQLAIAQVFRQPHDLDDLRRNVGKHLANPAGIPLHEMERLLDSQASGILASVSKRVIVETDQLSGTALRIDA